MNIDPHADLESSRSELPALAEARVDAIEASLFAEIARDRTHRRTRRSRAWVVGSAAAAVIVVAAVIAPSVGTIITGTGSNESGAAPASPLVDGSAGSAADSGVVSEGATSAESLEQSRDADAPTDTPAGDPTRDIITTASATVVVDDIAAAAAEIADAAESRDGYVESMSIGESGQVTPIDPMNGTAYDSTMPYPYTPDGAWITVRVPADGLQSLVDQLSGLGEVTGSSIGRQDVTAATVDLQARVDAAQASVDRLTELMAQASSLTDLITAEAALAERQATLESYQQQLKYYDDQVAMSTLTVTLAEPTETVEANPAGFGDGLVAGWNGLVATLNGIVIAIGFLLPWIVILAVAGLIVWGIVTLVRRHRSGRRSLATPTPPAAEPTSDE